MEIRNFKKSDILKNQTFWKIGHFENRLFRKIGHSEKSWKATKHPISREQQGCDLEVTGTIFPKKISKNKNLKKKNDHSNVLRPISSKLKIFLNLPIKNFKKIKSTSSKKIMWKNGNFEKSENYAISVFEIFQNFTDSFGYYWNFLKKEGMLLKPGIFSKTRDFLKKPGIFW